MLTRMTKLGWSQNEVARRTGLNVSVISRTLNSKSVPTLATDRIIRELLNIPPKARWAGEQQ